MSNRFEVRSSSQMDDDWVERDNKIIESAGRESDYSGGGCDDCGNCSRDHGWLLETFEAAVETKKRLEKVVGVRVVIREETTPEYTQ